VGQPNCWIAPAGNNSPGHAGHRSCSPYDGERLPSGAPRDRVCCLPRSPLSASYDCFASVCTGFLQIFV
jgi:hypothetical protein